MSIEYNNLNNFRKMLGITQSEFSEKSCLKDGTFSSLVHHPLPLSLDNAKTFKSLYNLSTYLDNTIESLVTSSKPQSVGGLKWYDYDYDCYAVTADFELRDQPSYKWLVAGNLIPILNNSEFVHLKNVLSLWSKEYEIKCDEKGHHGFYAKRKRIVEIGPEMLKGVFESLTSQEEITDEQAKKIFKAIVLGYFLVPKSEAD